MARNWAICIGINNYEFVGKLNYSQRDAWAMGDFCKTELKFDKVYYFAEGGNAIASEDKSLPEDRVLPQALPIEASPTFGHLDQFLDVQFEQRNFLNPQDNLWFFFAGHGIRDEGIDYLLPIDGNPNRIQKTGLPIHEVAERLRRCGAGNIVLMLDACRDGDSRKASVAGIGTEPQQGVVILFSCGPNERSYEIAKYRHGAFTYALLEGLRQKGPQNCATVDRLSAYVERRVSELNRPNNRRQTPSVRAEPAGKLHLILLPDRATVHDVAPLKAAAYRAEGENLTVARGYWIQVLDVLRADMDAIEAIERIVLTQANLSQKSNLSDYRTDKLRKTSASEAIYRQEMLAEGVNLEMMLIEGGSFLMGSPIGEGADQERPQHKVMPSSFWMSKYPITQVQWRAVAAMPKIEQDLHPTPSSFRGDNRPVEKVNWYEAVEFCQRLSQHTNRVYRLPSEAMWEYACRAGTTTPFHFGETITTALANYRGQGRKSDSKKYFGSYGSGSREQVRNQTTNVGSFPANAFGLYDMHGNVWEWCLDHWHTNHANALTDGGARLSSNKDSSRMLRGGSWSSREEVCRSAYRHSSTPVSRSNGFGFRVSYFDPRT